MRMCEARGLHKAWVRDHVDVSHVCLESWRKIRGTAGNQNLRLAGWFAREGLCSVTSALGPCPFIWEDLGDNVLKAGLSCDGGDRKPAGLLPLSQMLSPPASQVGCLQV